MDEITEKDKFRRWVEMPLTAVKDVPNGDGAMAALTMCFGLYERFVHSHVGSETLNELLPLPHHGISD